MLAERAGRPVTVVPGDDANVKITTPDDLRAARARVAAGRASAPATTCTD